MNTPAVTIVIPAHNVEQYLGPCLSSLTAQTAWASCLVLVVDDGSTDGTADVARSFAKRHPQIRLVQQENQGPGAGAARNNGLDLVESEFVLFLDGDDELTPGAIESLLGALESEGLDLAVGSTEQFPEPRTWLWSTYFTPGEIRRTRIEEVPLLAHDARTCNRMYRTEPLRRSALRFAEGIHHQDTVVNIPAILRYEEFMLVGDVVHRYRKRAEGGSVMDSHFTRRGNYFDHLQVIEELAAMLGSFEPTRRSLLETFIARSFQGFSWRAPDMLEEDDLPAYFDRAAQVIRRLGLQSILAGTRDASERSGYVTMVEDDFESYRNLTRLRHEVRAHKGDLYLNIPTADSELRDLLRTGATRAWIDDLAADRGTVSFRLRLRIQGADDLDSAFDFVHVAGMSNGKAAFSAPLTLARTEEPRVFTARVRVEAKQVPPGAHSLRLFFQTPTGSTARWCRPASTEAFEGAGDVRVGLRRRRIDLHEVEGRAAIRAT